MLLADVDQTDCHFYDPALGQCYAEYRRDDLNGEDFNILSEMETVSKHDKSEDDPVPYDQYVLNKIRQQIMEVDMRDEDEIEFKK